MSSAPPLLHRHWPPPLLLETVLDDGGDIPKPGSVSAHGKNPDFAGWIWTLNEVDPALLEDHTERVNITLPRRVLARLDAIARAAGESRNAFSGTPISNRPISDPVDVEYH